MPASRIHSKFKYNTLGYCTSMYVSDDARWNSYIYARCNSNDDGTGASSHAGTVTTLERLHLRTLEQLPRWNSYIYTRWNSDDAGTVASTHAGTVTTLE